MRRDIEKRLTMSGYTYIGNDIHIATGDQVDIYKDDTTGEKYGVIVMEWDD